MGSPVGVTSYSKVEHMIVPQVKKYTLFHVVSSTFAAILTPFLHKNNPFLAFQVHFYKITPFLYIQEHSKNFFFYYLHPSLIEKVILVYSKLSEEW